MIFSVIPEMMFIIIEFPVTTLLAWLLFCLKIKVGILGFLFNLVFWPVFFLGGLIAYLFAASRYPLESATLEDKYKDWIKINNTETCG